MVVLIDSSMFVRYGTAGLQIVKVKNTDQVYLKDSPSDLEVKDTIILNGVQGASNSTNELKVFDGRVTAKRLPRLMLELRDKKLLVNRDGYCYIWVPGFSLSTIVQPAKYMRLNDLFDWDEFIDSLPAGQTKLTPPPSTTVWTPLSFSGRLDADLKQAKKRAEDDKKKAEDDKKKAEDDKKKAEIDKKRAEDDKKKAEDDKKKAENDKKKAEDDKKKAEDDKKRAENDKKRAEDDKKRAENDKKRAEEGKKRAEDELQEVRKQKREMNEWMDRLKENWVNAANVGAKPLPPSAFYISSLPSPSNASGVQPLQGTWLGPLRKRLSDPGSYMSSIRTGSIQIYNSANGYGNDGFETHFWWVIQMDAPDKGVYGFMIAYDGTGRYPSPTDQVKFMYIGVTGGYSIGGLDLPGVGYRNVFILRDATQGTITASFH